jgi:hypothetical protein
MNALDVFKFDAKNIYKKQTKRHIILRNQS